MSRSGIAVLNENFHGPDTSGAFGSVRFLIPSYKPAVLLLSGTTMALCRPSIPLGRIPMAIVSCESYEFFIRSPWFIGHLIQRTISSHKTEPNTFAIAAVLLP